MRKENTKCGGGKKNSQSDNWNKFKRNKQKEYKNKWNEVFFYEKNEHD